MASWLKHPSYVPVREGLINHLRRTRYRFRRLDPVVFLCGASGSKSRDALRTYLHKHALPHLGVFYAGESLGSHRWLREREDALQMEAELANLADLVAVIVESPGTFTELGAFSLSPPLRRKKLLPIVDEQYRGLPVIHYRSVGRWIDNESDFTPTIYVSLSVILSAVNEIDERISRIPKSQSIKISDFGHQPQTSSSFSL